MPVQQTMSGDWYQSRPKGWPRHGFEKRLGAVLFGALVMFVFGAWRFLGPPEAGGLSGLQRFYVPHYVANQAKLLPKMRVLYTVDRSGREHPTVPAEVVDLDRRTVRAGMVPLGLSDAALKRGAVKLIYPSIQVNHENLERFFAEWVYQGRTLGDIFRPGFYLGFGVMLIGLCFAWPQDIKAQEVLEHGRRVRGPEMPTRYEFNKKRGHQYGIGWKLGNPMNLIERFYYKPPLNDMLLIPEQDVAKHFLLIGDTGSGKSALIRQMLEQLDRYGDTAIVYDPAQEYVKRFYKPQRGDVILNPLDERSPYWPVGEEIEHEAEARTMAESAFPDRPNEPHFFTTTPRKIFAQMLRYRMNAAQMLEMMRDGAALDRLVQGTELASIVSQSAPAQREGVRASLNLIADSLSLLKTEDQASAKWTAREWAKKKQGWIFVTSTPELRAPLQPLISLWLDLLVLRLMNPDNPSKQRVWFVLDELASLQRLPQLATALTENRKSNNPVVIGIQGKAQMETIYGHLAEAMLSQPWTKIFLKTSEPHAAEWVSKSIGDVDWEWLRETKSLGYQAVGQTRRETKSWVLEKRTLPLVMASQIGGLPALHGYLKNGNDVVPMVIPYLELPEKSPGFVMRKAGALEPLPPLPPREEPKGGQSQKREQKRQQGQERHFFE